MDKTNSQPQILDKEQFLKQERQVFFVWGLMVIFAIFLGFGWIILGQNERLWAQVTDFPNLSRAHSVSIAYDADDLPPAGGDHRPIWQNCGIYDYPPDSAQIVHSLEHGAVWLAYRPSLTADQVTALGDLISEQTEVIMSPYPELSGDVVLSAWGKQLVIESFPDERITAFIERFRGNGPEVGPICSGGAGTPLQAGGHL
jgi:hypothetical protein